MKIPTPVNSPIGQLFANPNQMYTNLGYRGHNGIDFGCPTGTPVKASIMGKVEFVGEDSSAGRGIYIISEFGGLIVRCIYWHLMSFNCSVGDTVEQGQVIGISDNTGMSTGPHLHFGMKPVKFNGTTYVNAYGDNGFGGSVDPFNYFVNPDISIFNNQIGAKGQFVKKIQELLNLNGCNLKVDGILGKKTFSATKDFQKKNKLKVDGRVGNKTMNKLLENI